MKKFTKIAAALCFNLIFWGSYNAPAQTVTSNNDLLTESFYCFAYDGGNVRHFVPANTGSLLTSPLLISPNVGKIKRSSMEDIMNENKENDQMMNTIGQVQPIEVNALFASKN